MSTKESAKKALNDEISESKFLDLQTEFRQQLPNTISSIEDLWKNIVKNKSNMNDLKKITHLILHLADAAGTYGTDEVSYIARKCYLTLKPFIGRDYQSTENSKITKSLDGWFMQLNVASNEWLSTNTSVLLPTKTKVNRNKRSVLYIEDNPANLRLVEQVLDSISYIHVLSAPEPLLGLELANENIPDLILLDINLPGMDGYQVLEKLRNQESTKDIPVIAVSANAMPKDIEKGKKAGFDGYITKPINVKELLGKVEGMLEKG